MPMKILNDYDIIADDKHSNKYKIKVSLYKCDKCDLKHMTTEQLAAAQEELTKCRKNGIIPIGECVS